MDYKTYEPTEVSTYRQVSADGWHNRRQELVSVLLADMYKEMAQKRRVPIGVVSVQARPVVTYEGEFFQVRAFVNTMQPLVDFQVEAEGHEPQAVTYQLTETDGS